MLSVFDDCGGSYQSLHHAIAEITLNMDENMHIRYEPTNDPSMSMDSMGNFIMNDANFWDEIIFMENEVSYLIRTLLGQFC